MDPMLNVHAIFIDGADRPILTDVRRSSTLQTDVPGSRRLMCAASSRSWLVPACRGFVPARRRLVPTRRWLAACRGLVPARRWLVPARRWLVPTRRGLAPARRGLVPARRWLAPARRGLAARRGMGTTRRWLAACRGMGTTRRWLAARRGMGTTRRWLARACRGTRRRLSCGRTPLRRRLGRTRFRCARVRSAGRMFLTPRQRRNYEREQKHQPLLQNLFTCRSAIH